MNWTPGKSPKGRGNTVNTPQAHFSRPSPIGNLPFGTFGSMSPEQSSAISQQAALYIRTLRQKREEIKLQREMIRGEFTPKLVESSLKPDALGPCELRGT